YPGFGPRPYATFTDGQLQLVRKLDPTKYKRYILPLPFSMFLNRHSYLYYVLNRDIYQRLRSTTLRRLESEDAHEVDPDTQFRIFFALVAETKKLLDAHGIDFLLVIIPTMQEVANGSSPVDDSILSYCRTNQVPCLPLLDRFVREKGESTYSAIDLHWTKAGHRIAADEISRRLSAPARASATP
ncbi:MAG TPA: hypothetical protein VMT89_09145, partial [Candidatus Acidoferrales bacterium]|nr:hypothetical protein [Candidatus Acidoferrales bacterium]